MPYQVSVFAENKPGKISKITSVFSKENINIRAVTISDAGDYGIIKLLVDKPEIACEKLSEAGITATLKEIIAVDIADKSGGLAEIATILQENQINVNDAYGFLVESHREAVFVFQVDNVVHCEKLLKDKGIKIMTDGEIYMI